MNERIEVYKQHREIQNKVTYVLMAVAASAIALSLKRTADSGITYFMIPLALAVLFWGLSFFCGYRYMVYVGASISFDLKLSILQEGRHPEIADDPLRIAAETQRIRKLMDYSNKKCKSVGTWQFRLLIIGALLFISWHVIEMGKITINSCG